MMKQREQNTKLNLDIRLINKNQFESNSDEIINEKIIQLISKLQKLKCSQLKSSNLELRNLSNCSQQQYEYYNQIQNKCEVCEDCSICDKVSSKRSNEIECSLCLYRKTGNVKRLDGSCQKLPDGQKMNPWGKIEGCDSITCNCVNDKCVSCKDPSQYIYPEINQCYKCKSGRYIDGIYCLMCKPKEEIIENDVACQTCLSKFVNCKECDEKQCKLCQVNYGFDLNNQCVSCLDATKMQQVGRFCIPKPNDCKTISENSINVTNKTIICDECNNLSQAKDNQTGSCISSCPVSQYMNNGQCISCTQKNCISCPNNRCETCKKDFMIFNNGDCQSYKQCVNIVNRGYMKDWQCIVCDSNNYYNNQCDNPNSCGSCEPCDTTFQYFMSDTCKKCHSDCKTCKGESDTDCIECLYQGYTLEPFNTQKKCKCKNYEQCLFCEGNPINCFRCFPGYTTEVSTKGIVTCSTDRTIVSKCPLNYKEVQKNQDKRCYCNSPNCRYCDLNDGAKCLICYEGFELTSDKVCKQCPPNSVYDKKNQKCNCLDSNCNKCESTDGSKCTQCETGFFVNSKKQCEQCASGQVYDSVQNKCVCGIKNCSICNSTNTSLCDECMNGFVKNSSGNQCEECQNGFIFDSALKKCVCSVKGCQKCQTSNGVVCEKCNTGFELNTNSQCSECQPNYIYDDASQKCLCGVQQCNQCDPINGKICQKCNNGYQFNSNKQVCEICLVNNCLTCVQNTTNQCQNCQQGYNVNSQIKCDISIPQCIELNSNDPFKCIKCAQNFKLENNSCICNISNCQNCNYDGSICNKCNDNYFLNNTQTQCKICSLQGCKKCKENDSSQCEICQDGYKNNNKGACDIKIENCIKLNSNDVTMCDTCKDGFIVDQKICKCSIDNCVNCIIEGNKCKVCQDGFEWENSSNKCNCSIKNCIECDINNYGKCQTCQNGYIKDSIGQICGCSSQNCEKCNSLNGQLCDKCNSGFVLENQKCVKCQVNECSLCVDGNSSKCQVCKDGFKNKNNGISCEINIQNCAVLDPNNSSKCQTCETNYVKNNVSNCECKISNCVDCNISASDNSCIACQKGFSFNSQTKQCECSLKNCSECDTQLNYGQCKICVSGYVKGPSGSCECQLSNCSVCNPSDGSKCIQCNDQHILDQALFRCQKCQVDNCKQCTENDPKTCKTCQDGYVQDSGNKICKINIPNCIELNQSDKSKCNKCEQNYQLDQNEKCICSVQNCINCQIDVQGKCLNCQNGFEWDDSNNQCMCSLKNCQECDTQQYGTCKICVNGYKLNSNKICVCQIVNCKTCNKQSANICDECNDNYVLDIKSQQCTTCKIDNCQSCQKNNPNLCQICNSGYKLSKTDTCEKNQDKCLVQNCLSCDIANNQACKQCAKDYSINLSRQSCELCGVKDCQQCDPNNYLQCQICNLGYTSTQQKDKCQKQLQTFTLKPTLTKQGYEVQVVFEYDIVYASTNKLQDLMKFQISNLSNYTSNEKQTSSNIITIQIQMKESCKDQKITVEFTANDYVKINNMNNNKSETTLPIFVFYNEPKQDEGTKVVTQTTQKIAVVSSVGLAVLGSFFSVFSLVDTTAFIYFLFFVNVNHPSSIEDFSKLFGNFQFAFMPDFISQDISSKYVIESPHKFMSKGMDSFFLKNASHSISLSLIVLGTYLFLKALSYAPIKVLQRLLIRGLKKGWENNAIVYTVWIVFTYMSVACTLQLTHLQFSGPLSSLSYILFLIAFLGIFATPIIFSVLIHKHQDILLKPYAIKFSSIILGIKVNTIQQENPPTAVSTNRLNNADSDVEIKRSTQKISAFSLDDISSFTTEIPVNIRPKQNYHNICKYTNPILFGRKILFSMFIVFMHGETSAQLSLISIMNVIMIGYFIKFKPYIRMIDNIKSGVTEVIFIIIQILASQLKDVPTEYNENKRSNIGYAYVSFCIIILSIHTIDLVFQLCSAILIFIKPLLKKQTIKTLPTNFVNNNAEKTVLMNNVSVINTQIQKEPQSQISMYSHNQLDVEKALSINQEKVGDSTPSPIKKSERKKRTKKYTDFFGQNNQSNLNEVNIPNSDQKIENLADMSFQATSKIQSANISFNGEILSKQDIN